MKILHVIAGAQHGGAESCAVDTIKALEKNNIEQALICRPHRHFHPFKDLLKGHYYNVKFNKPFKWLDSRKINRIIAIERPDLVHCWMNRAATVTAAQNNTPVLGWFGGYYDLKYYKNCNFYMGVTKDIVGYIEKHPMNNGHTYLGHPFGTLEKKKEFKKSDFGIPNDAKVVLLLSRMHKKKGVDLLIKAAKQIDNAYFLLAGDGPELASYKELAEHLNISNRVIFLGWCDDRLALLKLADICTLPSRYEPFGIVMTESWFAEVPLVATKAAGALGYVNHGADGLLVEIDDLNGLVKALKECLANEQLRNKLVSGGKLKYEKEFSQEVIVRKLIASYKDMILRHEKLL